MADQFQNGEAVENIPASGNSEMSEAVASVPAEAVGSEEGGVAGGALPSETSAEQIVTQLQSELEAEHTRYDELNDRFQRSSAEFQNTLRRREKLANETIERASTHVILKLLPVIDDLDRAFQAVPPTAIEGNASLFDGFRQIQKKLAGVLEEEGVTVIALDGEFDPTRHEAISSEPSETVSSGNIIATLRVGYEQRGRVLRPALVRVAA